MVASLAPVPKVSMKLTGDAMAQDGNIVTRVRELEMKIADKLMNGIDIDKEEYKFLLWNTLIQLSPYDDNVDCVEKKKRLHVERVERVKM